MASDTKIQWADMTFNPWRGCTKVSPGCANCYADAQSKRNPTVLGVWGPDGKRVVASEAMWREPLKWDREAAKAGVRKKVFCASLADVFEDWRGPMHGPHGERLFHDSASPPWMELGAGREVTMAHVRDRLFDLIEETPNLNWLLLTKRPENIAPTYDRLLTRRPFVVHDSKVEPRHERWTTWKEIGTSPARMWPNVWLGVSVEDQQRADERIPILLQTPAAVRFLSVEPQLGPINLHPFLCKYGNVAKPEQRYGSWCDPRDDGIGWVIVGGESGRGSRPFEVEWAESLVLQCDAAGVPCFVKQVGAKPQRLGLTLLTDDPKGGDPECWPSTIRVRQFPGGSLWRND